MKHRSLRRKAGPKRPPPDLAEPPPRARSTRRQDRDAPDLLQRARRLGHRIQLDGATGATVRRVWKESESGKVYWEGSWNTARLMKKGPDFDVDLEKYEPPKALFWDTKEKKYTPTIQTYDYTVMPVSKFETDSEAYRELLFWREFAKMEELAESAHIIDQIIDSLGDEESEDMLVLAYVKPFLVGVSIFSLGGTTEGAPEIPEDEESDWYYVHFSAANPFSQIDRKKRGPVHGGVGSAMNKHHEFLAKYYGKGQFPIYRHAENPISYLSLLRSGYEDVYAEKDKFPSPDL